MNKQKVYWLLDEVFAKTHPGNWNEAVDLTNKLIALIGNNELEHQIINPLHSFKKAVSRLSETSAYRYVQTIVDISGWVGNGLKPLLPDAEFFTGLSLSRILDVSTPDFRRVGYVMNMTQEEIKKRAAGLDLSSVLIVDDTGITGKTSQLVMEALGVNPKDATHLFLFGNLGNFPTRDNEPVRPGAVALLEGLGSKVIYGDVLTTPKDDAEHVCDMFGHPVLEAGFNASIKLREQTRGSERYREQLNTFLANKESADDLFPQRIEEADITRLSAEGRFAKNPGYTASKDSVYSTNPLLWAFSDFWKKTDEPLLLARKDSVLDVLKDLSLLTTSQNCLSEVQAALREQTKSVMGKERRG